MDFKSVFKKVFTSRWFIFCAAALAVYSLTGFFLLPYLASHYLKKYVQEQLAHELVLQKLRFNPFAFSVEVQGLDLTAKKQAPLLAVDFFSANFDVLSSLKEQAWTFSSIRITDPFLRFVVQADGRSNLSMLFKDVKAGKPKQTNQAANQSMPKFLFKDVRLQGGKINFVDRRVSPPAEVFLRSLNLDLEGISTNPASTVDFDLKTHVEPGGEMSAKGQASIWNRTLQGHARLKDLSLLPLQPYLQQLLRLTLDSGSLDAFGQFSYGNGGKEGEKGFTFQGQGSILSLRARTGDNDQAPWGWDSLSCDAVHLSLSPGDLQLGKVTIVGPSGSLIIYPDKTVNLSRFLIQAKDKKKTTKSEAFRIIVNHIQLEQGSLEFADLSLSLPFRAQITDLQGSINGISSIAGTSAQIDLEGQVNKNGMTRIRGETDLFHPTGTTKISIDFRNIAMTSLTPFSVYFAGYRVASGKLDLDLHYRIENGKMVGRNRITAKNFTLGERVKSATALDLPFKFAIALLKDSNGIIDVRLPVSGDLNKPHFDFGEIIRTAVADFLEKIITAPFAWLAALVGYDKEDFEAVFFDPGKANLLPPEKEKLDKLSEALAKRPRLGLKIQGGYDPAVDIPALKSALLRKKVASQQNQALKPGANSGPLVFHDPATQKALEALFLEYYPAKLLSDLKADFRKTLQPAGNSPDEEKRAAAWTDFYKDLYRRIKKQITIPEGRLESLAESRGAAVRRFLMNAEHVASGRIRVLSPIRTKNRSSREVQSKLSLDVAGGLDKKVGG